MLRVRTGPECPEGNRMELTRDSNLNCGIARERERKLTGQNTLWALHRTKEELRDPRGELASCGPAHPPLEAGGSGEGKGANSASETAPKMQTGSQFLTKDFLRFWMVDIHRQGHG